MSVKHVFSLLLFFVTFNVIAEPVPAPKGLEYCTVCHGAQLKGNINIRAPRLSGLPGWYIEKQLFSFKKSWRGDHALDLTGTEMRPMVSELSDKQIKAAAEWASQTESPLPAKTLTADIKAGEQIYKICSACHDSQAQGNNLIGAPPLTGLNDWYLVTQLQHFRDGIRGSHPEDIQGVQMRAALSVIQSDQELIDVAAYISQLPK